MSKRLTEHIARLENLSYNGQFIGALFNPETRNDCQIFELHGPKECGWDCMEPHGQSVRFFLIVNGNVKLENGCVLQKGEHFKLQPGEATTAYLQEGARALVIVYPPCESTK